MPRITFTEDALYKNIGPKRGVAFREGAVIDTTVEFAERWIKRGKAEVTGRGEPKSGERWTVVKGKVDGSHGQRDLAGEAASMEEASRRRRKPSVQAEPEPGPEPEPEFETDAEAAADVEPDVEIVQS